MVMWKNIFAVMAVTLRMSSAVRLYIVHSVKEKGKEKRREERGDIVSTLNSLART